MVKPAADNPSAESLAMEPKPTSTLTYVLNGVGNGSMLAAATVGGYSLLVHKHLPNKVSFGNIAAVTVGVVLGGLQGLNEARHIRRYREHLSGEFNALKTRVAQLESEHAGSHGEKISAKRREMADTSAER